MQGQLIRVRWGTLLLVNARSKLALKYFIAAIFLFVAGYGLAWFSETPFFSKEVFPKKLPSVAASNTAAPDTEKKASAKPGREYTVQPGDTISKIAQANGLAFEELAQYNDIPYPYNLVDGQVIIIPEK